LAKEELGCYEPMAGESVAYAAERMFKVVTLTGDQCTAHFNDIGLVVNPGDKPDNIVSFYFKESERRSQEYRESPAGKRAAQEVEDRRKRAQNMADQAVVDMAELDYTNRASVINWLERIREPSDHVGVDINAAGVVEKFEDHGFKLGVNCGDDFDGENEENFARWLIGQALDNLNSSGFIHQMFHTFAKDYRKKFVQA
jgi:hypothetical protein